MYWNLNLAHLATAWIPSDSVRRSSKHSLSLGKSTFFAAHSSKSSEFGTEATQIDMPICLVSCDNCDFFNGLHFSKHLHLLNGMVKHKDSRNVIFFSVPLLDINCFGKRMLLITRRSYFEPQEVTKQSACPTTDHFLFETTPSKGLELMAFSGFEDLFALCHALLATAKKRVATALKLQRNLASHRHRVRCPLLCCNSLRAT